MSDYQTDSYRKQGGSEWVVKTLTVASGGKITDTDGKWDDLRVPMTAVRTAGSKIPGFDATIGTINAYSFDDSTEEEVHFYVQVPHDWKVGTDVEPHLHWTSTASSTNTDVVRWGLEYTLVDIGGTFPAPSTMHATDIPAGVNKHEYTDLGTIDMSTVSGPSCMIMMRLYRDATSTADTYGADASAIEFDLHYQRATLGTTSETG